MPPGSRIVHDGIVANSPLALGMSLGIGNCLFIVSIHNMDYDLISRLAYAGVIAPLHAKYIQLITLTGAACASNAFTVWIMPLSQY